MGLCNFSSLLQKCNSNQSQQSTPRRLCRNLMETAKLIMGVRDNVLVELPDSIGTLVNLKTLILSCNKLTRLPDGLSRLHQLIALDVSNNQLEALLPELARLTNLEVLDASGNRLISLDQLPPNLHTLDLSKNRIERLPENLVGCLPHLRSLDVSSNQLTNLVLDTRDPSARATSKVASIHASLNRLTCVPDVAGLTSLKELCVSDNRITTFVLDHFQGCPLTNLNLARNAIDRIPQGISVVLPNLARLDVSGNNLNSLPTELGLLNSLQALILEGNPLRSIRQSIISSGTNAVKDLLLQRHVSDPEVPPITQATTSNPVPQSSDVQPSSLPVSVPKASGGDHTPGCSQTARKDYGLAHVTPAGVLSWNEVPKGESYTPLPDLDSEPDWLLASGFTASNPVKVVNLEYRLLPHFPRGLFAFTSSLSVLNLSCNRLTELPEDIDRFGKLCVLDLTRNSLCTLPQSLSALSQLTTLKLDGNPLGPKLPNEAILVAPLANSLEHLSLRGCKLREIPEVSRLQASNAPRLVYLDLSDNDIDTLPPELGLCTHLKSLHLNGNTFRIPRPNVIAKGTPAVLEYLRSRIPC
ncbi:unnamed protein product [Dicrocoelium dendriticum]|nr:unnamed protein product [Dicrocoelium dendriticum]